MKKLIEKIQNYIDKYVIKRFSKLAPKKIIEALYRNQQIGDLKLTSREISVKKGKRKYTLLIIETQKGFHKFNLGRIY